MRKEYKHENLMIEFISSGMGSCDYRITECGRGFNGSNPETRLRIRDDDKTTASYCIPDGQHTITPEKVIALYNLMIDGERAAFEEWAAAHDYDFSQDPKPAHLATVKGR